MLRRSALLSIALASTLALGCSSGDGRTLRPPGPDQTTTSSSAPPAVDAPEGSSGVVEVFSLASSAFAPGGEIPARHTCAGEDLSPPLAWASTPSAAELALVVRDSAEDGFVHWVVTGIDPIVQGMGEGGVPESAVQATNDAGTVGWSGPCPDPRATHTYVFTLHALPEPLTLEPGLPGQEAARLVEGASSEQASLTGTVTFTVAG